MRIGILVVYFPSCKNVRQASRDTYHMPDGIVCIRFYRSRFRRYVRNLHGEASSRTWVPCLLIHASDRRRHTLLQPQMPSILAQEGPSTGSLIAVDMAFKCVTQKPGKVHQAMNWVRPGPGAEAT